MKSILVTGGAGFIGSNFVPYFAEKYPEYFIINLDKLTYAGNLENLRECETMTNYKFVQGNICDEILVQSLFEKYDIRGVIHFAAESHVDNSIKGPKSFMETNFMGTFNLIENARRHWMEAPNQFKSGYESCRFHHISTDEVYGTLGETGYFSEETPYAPNSPYSASKAGSDFIVRAYHYTYGMNVTTSNCSNNYGPYHFPEKLIPLIIKNILEGKKLPVYGDGKNVRDWLYVEDHCKAIDLVLRKGREGEVYNVGGHNEKENIEIVKLTIATIHRMMTETPEYRKILKKKELNDKGEISIDWINESLITFVKDRLGHDQRYAIDPTKITNELGWYPETKFETGIVKTIQWYLENQAWVENVTSGDYQKYYERMYKNR